MKIMTLDVVWPSTSLVARKVARTLIVGHEMHRLFFRGGNSTYFQK
jgi:hypothetical protein